MELVLVRVLAVLTLSVWGLEGSYLRDPKNVQNREHIKEHMGEYYEEEKEIDEELESDEALRFHYFKLHDYNNDNKLDGLELYSAINHFSEHGAEGHGDEGQNPLNVTSEEQVVRIVDMVLQMDDKNNDGFVDYFEFSTAMEEAKEAEENPNEI